MTAVCILDYGSGNVNSVFNLFSAICQVAVGDDSYLLLPNRTVHEPISPEQLQQWRSGWTQERRQIGESLVRQRRLGKTLTKVPAFTAEQVKGLLPHGVDPGKRNIAIYNGTIDEYAGIEGWENPIYRPDETAGVQAILEAFEADDRFMFYLRVHPHMKELPGSTSQLADIRGLSARFANLRVIWPADAVDSYALMNACEKVLTFGSTIGMEATYWAWPREPSMASRSGQTLSSRLPGRCRTSCAVPGRP